MECRKVKEWLSEYLDGMLDEEASALVQTHLSECADCRKEYASLKALVRELGTMEAVSPPADFLDRIHERMEEPSWFSKLMHTLFVPLRFKIPLEFAAVALVAVVIFSLLNVQFGAYRAAKSPEEQLGEEIGDMAGDAFTFNKQEAPEPEAPVKKRVTKALEQEQKPFELLLTLREQRPSRLMAKASRAPVPGRDRLKSSPERDAHPDSEKRDLASQGPVADKAQPPQAYQPVVVQKVRDAIIMVGGQIITLEEAWKNDDSRTVIARIPAKKVPLLLEELRPLGTLQSPMDMPPDTYEGPMQVRIKILPE